jgi:hypothetical protein
MGYLSYNKTDNVNINVKLQCARVTIVVEKQYILRILSVCVCVCVCCVCVCVWCVSVCVYGVCVCSLEYPTSNAHASYIAIFGLPDSTTFTTLSHKRHDFRRENQLNIKCVFSIHLLPKNFLILRKIQLDNIINVRI